MRSLLDTYAGQTVLAIGAHPDDVEIGAGGTVARLARAGARVIIVAAAVPDNLEERLGEAARAAEILGAELEVLERERCRRVEDFATYELVGRLDALVKRYQPAALLSHSSREIHMDHVLIHRAVLSAMRLRPMDVYFYNPSTCKPTLQSWQPRLWVDVSSTIDAKIRAIAAHQSQFGKRGICVDFFRQHARAQGFPVGFEHAEGLDVLCLRD
jgi:LmbE family N-acetylglucosaminyl deacetylase